MGSGNSSIGTGSSNGHDSSRVILIADDEASIADVICMLVEDAGFTPMLARHGREALDIARAVRPALIITDLMMPLMTGTDLVAALRADHEGTGALHIPIILMTAANPSAAHAVGADAILYKPFQIDALEALLHKLLG